MVTLVEIGTDWRRFANCLGTADLADNPFFVEGYGANYPIAREYCSTCRVVIDCLMECIVDGSNLDDEGMWGCMSPNERRTMIRGMNKGETIKQAAERIWSKQRSRPNGSAVPPLIVWREWDA